MDLLLKLAKYTSTWIPFPTLSRTLVFPSVGPRLAPNDPNSLHRHSATPGPSRPSAASSKCRRKCQVCLLQTGNTIRHHHQKIDSSCTSFQPSRTKVSTEWTNKNPSFCKRLVAIKQPGKVGNMSAQGMTCGRLSPRSGVNSTYHPTANST